MARTHGKAATFTWNSLSFSDELSSIEQAIEVPAADITSFDDAWQNALAGKKNVRTTVQGALDMLRNQGDDVLFSNLGGGAKSSVFDPTGAGPAADAPQYKCTASGLTGALIAEYNIDLPVGDKAGYTVTFQHSGETTRAVA